MAWFLNRALSNFRAAVNARWPDRDRASDGTIGDEAHQGTNSDHNPDSDGSVDAWDMDDDGVDTELLKRVFEAHESAGYWIHNRQIARRSTGWRREVYTGSNPHTSHVHWNTRQSHETSNAAWVIPQPQEDDMEQTEQLLHYEGKMVGHTLADTQKLRDSLMSPAGADPFAPPAGSHLAELYALPARLVALEQAVERLSAPAPVDVAGLAAALAPHIEAAAENAVRKVLGSLDGQ